MLGVQRKDTYDECIPHHKNKREFFKNIFWLSTLLKNKIKKPRERRRKIIFFSNGKIIRERKKINIFKILIFLTK